MPLPGAPVNAGFSTCFVVGLALHNLVMAQLYGGRPARPALTVVASWKEVLLAGGLACFAVCAIRTRALPFRPTRSTRSASRSPRSSCSTRCSRRARSAATRPAGDRARRAPRPASPVAAYFLGRGLALAAASCAGSVRRSSATAAGARRVRPGRHLRRSRSRGGATRARRAGSRTSSASTITASPGCRRTSSTTSATSGRCGGSSRPSSPRSRPPTCSCVALLLAAAWRRRTAIPLAAVCFGGLLWTYSRSTWFALVVGLVVLAAAQRRLLPLVLAVAAIGVFAGYAAAFTHVAPRAHFTPTELDFQHEAGKGQSHRAVARERRLDAQPLAQPPRRPLDRRAPPAGLRARQLRLDRGPLRREAEAGESTYTEVGVDTGVAGLALFVAFNLALLWRLRFRSAWLVAALAAVLVLAVQTDAIGVPWLAFCLWLFAGAESDILVRSIISPPQPRSAPST